MKMRRIFHKFNIPQMCCEKIIPWLSGKVVTSCTYWIESCPIFPYYTAFHPSRTWFLCGTLRDAVYLPSSALDCLRDLEKSWINFQCMSWYTYYLCNYRTALAQLTSYTWLHSQLTNSKFHKKSFTMAAHQKYN